MENSGLINYAEKRTQARIRLDLTANPLGPPEAVANALQKLTVEDCSKYPEPAELSELVGQLALRSGIEPDQIMLTCGADSAIEIILTHILNSTDTLGIRTPAFPRFEIVARMLCGATIVQFNDIEHIPSCHAVCLCTPNNPTTEELDVAALRTAMQKNPKTWFLY